MNQLVVQNTSTLQSYLNHINQYPILPIEQERELFVKYNDGDHSVIPTIVTHNLRYVAYVALTQYGSYKLPPEDLIQEGNMGLLQSIPGYDLKHNVRFITYANYRIQSNIREYIRKNNQIFDNITCKRIKKIKNNYHKMDRSQLSSNLNVTEKDIVAYEDISKIQYISIEQSAEESMDDAPFELASDYDLLDELISEEDQQYMEKIKASLDILDDRYRDIFVSRNLQEPPMTMQDLAEKYGISKERVRQLEKLAKYKLSTHLGFSVEKVQN